MCIRSSTSALNGGCHKEIQHQVYIKMAKMSLDNGLGNIRVVNVYIDERRADRRGNIISPLLSTLAWKVRDKHSNSLLLILIHVDVEGCFHYN